MKKYAFGIVELLVCFLFMSVLVAIGMRMSLNQMEQYRLEKATSAEQAKELADKQIEQIQEIKDKKLKFEQDVMNNFGE